MRIQSRRSGRMVEESMGSLGIDSRWLDIRVTTGREEERSTTELLVVKERTRPPFVHFYWSRHSNSERKTRRLDLESTSSRVNGCVALSLQGLAGAAHLSVSVDPVLSFPQDQGFPFW